MNMKGYTITDRWLDHDMMELVLGEVMCPTNPPMLDPIGKSFKW